MKMTMHTDHHIAIGHQHLSDGKPCQDHALSGVVSEFGETYAYAVVSDGCSTAGETDIGARLITTLTAKAFRDDYRSGDAVSIDSAAFDVAQQLGLDPDDLLATHLYAVIDTTGEGHVMVKGDGVVVFV